MVPSRALLLLIAALALPITVSTGCSDSDSSSKDEDPATDEDGKDESGEKGDASVRTMDGSLRDARVGTSGDGAVDEEDGDDAGEQTATDSGVAPDATTTNDGGSGQDAAVDGMDAATDAGDAGDAGKADATVDSGKLDSGKPDAGTVDAGEEEEEDAGSEDAGKADADAGKADAGESELTDEDCVEAQGDLKDDDESCEANQIKYELKGNKICCVNSEQEEGTCGGITGTACPAGEFCDISKYAGGQGCGVADGTGKCRPIPTSACTDVPVGGGCGCDKLPHTLCDGWVNKISVEANDFTCLLPAP